jgi:hypothetical protein
MVIRRGVTVLLHDNFGDYQACEMSTFYRRNARLCLLKFFW